MHDAVVPGLRCVTFCCSSRAWCTADAAAPPTTEADFVIKDFTFASGETLPELRIHYRTSARRRRTRRVSCATPC